MTAGCLILGARKVTGTNAGAEKTVSKQGDNGSQLTEGEVACIRLLIEGMTDGEIAASLDIAPATAHWRIERAKKKLGAKTRAQLTGMAVAGGHVRL